MLRPTPLLALPLLAALAAPAWAQQDMEPGPEDVALDGPGPDLTVETEDGTLRVEITRGIIEPTDIALAGFHDEGGAGPLAAQIQAVIGEDLTGTGLFHAIPPAAHLEDRASFDAPVRWQSWRAIHAEALVTGAVSRAAGQVTLKFRLHDVVEGEPLGAGIRLDGAEGDWRRLAHKAADQIYTRLTGEGPYLDSRIVLVAEDGPSEARRKRLAIIDQDGAGFQYLSDGRDLVLSPKLAPDGRRLVFTSFSNGVPRVAVLDLDSGRTQIMQSTPGTMSFAPNWSPDGRWIAYSQEEGGATNLWLMDAASGAARPLTRGPSIDTSPDFSPDGRRIVFESDRSGQTQLYVLSLDEGGAAGLPEARRISFGAGSYGTPAWSPRGDLIAFTRSDEAAAAEGAPPASGLRIGVMRPDGNGERLLTAAHLDEGPSWSPNGRVIAFARRAVDGTESGALHSIDVTGRNLRRIQVSGAVSDPDWGPLRP